MSWSGLSRQVPSYDAVKRGPWVQASDEVLELRGALADRHTPEAIASAMILGGVGAGFSIGLTNDYENGGRVVRSVGRCQNERFRKAGINIQPK